MVFCPVCGGELFIKVLKCKRCGTKIIGEFDRTPFDRLNKEQMEFILDFLKSWGNFSDLARKYNLSYPTVRSKFAQILEVMGLKDEVDLKIMEVLDKVERGEITPEEAEKVIRNLKGNG